MMRFITERLRSLVSLPSSSSQLTSHTNHPTDKNQFHRNAKQKIALSRRRNIIINGNFASRTFCAGLDIRRFRESRVCSVTRFNYTQKVHFLNLKSVSKQL